MKNEIGQVCDRIRIGRGVSAETIVQQIGLPTVLAISGGNFGTVLDTEGYPIGIVMSCGINREVEVTLNFLDLYTVRRYRRIVSGANRGQDVLEFEEDDMYCDQVSESAWRASLWNN